jgi:hypothetical protein
VPNDLSKDQIAEIRRELPDELCLEAAQKLSEQMELLLATRKSAIDEKPRDRYCIIWMKNFTLGGEQGDKQTRELRQAARNILHAAAGLEHADHRHVAACLARIIFATVPDDSRRRHMPAEKLVRNPELLGDLLRFVAILFETTAKVYMIKGIKFASLERHVQRLPILLRFDSGNGPDFSAIARVMQLNGVSFARNTFQRTWEYRENLPRTVKYLQERLDAISERACRQY